MCVFLVAGNRLFSNMYMCSFTAHISTQTAACLVQASACNRNKHSLPATDNVYRVHEFTKSCACVCSFTAHSPAEGPHGRDYQREYGYKQTRYGQQGSHSPPDASQPKTSIFGGLKDTKGDLALSWNKAGTALAYCLLHMQALAYCTCQLATAQLQCFIDTQVTVQMSQRLCI